MTKLDQLPCGCTGKHTENNLSKIIYGRKITLFCRLHGILILMCMRKIIAAVTTNETTAMTTRAQKMPLSGQAVSSWRQKSTITVIGVHESY